MTGQGPPAVAAASARPSTIASRLRRIVWLMLIPTTAISLIAGFLVYRAERDTVVEAASETARALSLVADRELAVRSALLRSLALSPTLERGDLEAFRKEALRLVPEPGNVIALTDTSGRQLMNTRIEWGRPLPQGAAFAMPRDPPSQSLLVSDLYRAPLGGAYSFAVGVPVHVDGKLRGYLGMGSVATQMQRIFEQQPLPKPWLGVVLDRQGQVVARTLDPEQRVGARSSEKLRAAMRAAPRGVVAATTLDGVEVFTVFNRAPESGWTVLIGLHRDELRGAALRAFGTMMLLSLVFTGLALWAAGRASRPVVKLLEQLQADARTLGQGGIVVGASSGVLEIDTVQRSLVRASEHRASADERLRQEVEQAVRTAERASQTLLRGQKLEALGQLTGGIAHDFNNLLQTMSTGLQLAQRLAADPRAERALAGCSRAVTRAAKLTQQLMTFGRQQGGRDEVVDLEASLRSLFELIRGAVSEGITIVLDLHTPLWAARLDPVQLELALLNLAFNARDAMHGRGELTVRAENRSLAEGEAGGLPAGDYVAILVRDTGTGMTSAVVERAFEPFFTTKSVGKGSGLGLAQVYGFASKAGGLATIDSVIGVGTTVTLWLPRSEQPVADAIDAARGAPAPACEATVLIVEDEPTVLELVSEALHGLGFRTITASDGEQALHIIQERADIDVVLSDVVMPGEMNGIDLASTLKVLRPALPVILASGYAEKFDPALAIDFIAKPYDVEVLAGKISELLGRTRS